LPGVHDTGNLTLILKGFIIFTTEAPRSQRKDLLVCPAISRTNQKHQSFRQLLTIYIEICIRQLTLTTPASRGSLSRRYPNITNKDEKFVPAQVSLKMDMGSLDGKNKLAYFFI